MRTYHPQGETHYWQIWNGLIQMRIREEICVAREECREGGADTVVDAGADADSRGGLVGSRERLAALVSKFEVAFGKYSAVSREEDANLKPSFSAMEIFMQQLKAHGGCMWVRGRPLDRGGVRPRKHTCPHASHPVHFNHP